MADERLNDHGREKLMGLLNAGDPKGQIFVTWRAKELVRGLYDHCDPALALEFVQRFGNDLQDPELPKEARSLGRTPSLEAPDRGVARGPRHECSD